MFHSKWAHIASTKNMDAFDFYRSHFAQLMHGDTWWHDTKQNKKHAYVLWPVASMKYDPYCAAMVLLWHHMHRLMSPVDCINHNLLQRTILHPKMVCYIIATNAFAQPIEQAICLCWVRHTFFLILARFPYRASLRFETKSNNKIHSEEPESGRPILIWL